MKYLKKFNEELKAQTYKSAARKLKKILKEKPVLGKAIGAEERANKLELYSKDVQERQDIEAWKKEIEQFSKYGEFNIEMSRPGAPSIKPKVYSFYLDIVTEIEQMIDSWDDEDPDNRELTFGFCAGLIPKTIEDREEIKMNFNSDFWNGHTWGFWIYPTYKVLNSEVTFKGLTIYDYDSSPDHQIADRKTAVALKRLLVNIFDPTFDYPSGYKDITNMYDKIERDVIQGLEISATYGIDMGRIQEDIKKLPIMDFYIQ
jgi:hypothetical protein